MWRYDVWQVVGDLDTTILLEQTEFVLKSRAIRSSKVSDLVDLVRSEDDSILHVRTVLSPNTSRLND